MCKHVYVCCECVCMFACLNNVQNERYVQMFLRQDLILNIAAEGKYKEMSLYSVL